MPGARSNNSLAHERLAIVEAMTMLFSSRSRDKVNRNCNKFFVSDDIFEQTYSVLVTRAEPLGIQIVRNSIDKVVFDDDFFGLIKTSILTRW